MLFCLIIAEASPLVSFKFKPLSPQHLEDFILVNTDITRLETEVIKHTMIIGSIFYYLYIAELFLAVVALLQPIQIVPKCPALCVKQVVPFGVISTQ